MKAAYYRASRCRVRSRDLGCPCFCFARHGRERDFGMEARRHAAPLFLLRAADGRRWSRVCPAPARTAWRLSPWKPVSSLRPLPQQVVIHAGELLDRIRVGATFRELADGGVELQQGAALRFVAHEALDPEERGHARTTGDRFDAVQA